MDSLRAAVFVLGLAVCLSLAPATSAAEQPAGGVSVTADGIFPESQLLLGVPFKLRASKQPGQRARGTFAARIDVTIVTGSVTCLVVTGPTAIVSGPILVSVAGPPPFFNTGNLYKFMVAVLNQGPDVAPRGGIRFLETAPRTCPPPLPMVGGGFEGELSITHGQP